MKSLVRKPARRGSTVAGAGALAVVLAASLAPAIPAQGAGGVATVYVVTQEGLTVNDGTRLAEAFRVGNALYPNGSFQYVDAERFQALPKESVGQGKDEEGNPTVSTAVDLAALAAIKPYPEDQALAAARRLSGIALLSEGMSALPVVSHSNFSLNDDKGNVVAEHAIDTQVSFDITLDGLPLTGQGANLRISFDGGGTVTELSQSLRRLAPSRQVPVISPDEARADCKRLYGDAVEQGEPTLGYQMPELTSQNADGRGTVKEVWPQYTCRPAGQDTTQASRLVPAVRESAPSFTVDVQRQGDSVSATSKVSGGTAPYSYQWSSSTTVLDKSTDPSVGYRRTARDGAKGESVTLEVTDANGITALASVVADGDGGFFGGSQPGGGGFALGSVGISQTVDEWQCAQASANGFKSVMQSKGQFVDHDWRGASSWEKDFKDSGQSGWDYEYADDVDAQWYTGHGWSGGFTFKSSVNDTSIVPSDLRLGDVNNEWLQLESCQVLRDTNGSHDYISRWGQSFRGMHMMNGFHTNAYCVGGGTGGTFAKYLFPQKFLWWTIRPAYTVRKAWATMALLKEPHGVVYRSFGPARYLGGGKWLTNAEDHYWQSGYSTGPDIMPTGWWWTVSGTV
ncbi:DUF6345 domain-containing protein [Phytomonospora sp. NPDC050363]|uniref:DUF6345 domain-containing protein n=1 Tax=Phytomonospora sp. NPDC050363 TaxID=3155642 RepID=UPI0033E6DEC4